VSDEPLYGPPRAPFQREKLPKGPMQAIVFRVFGLGLQAKAKGDPQWQIIVYFEVNYRYKEGKFEGKRALLNQVYTIGWGERAWMRRDYQRILNREFTPEELKDVTKLNLRMIEGHNCMVNVVHREKEGITYNNIDGVFTLMDGLAPMTLECDPKFIPPYVEKLLQNRVATTPEGAAQKAKDGVTPAQTSQAAPADFDDDIPF